MIRTVAFRLNGKPVTVTADPARRLPWVLRTELGLTGAKYGCGAGACGSCTVVVDGRAVRSCQASLESVAGKDVTSIEGLERAGELHPLQAAFVELGALQRGYCTPGMVLDRGLGTCALPRFSWLPRIETVLVKNDALAPQGGGEPAIVPLGAAVANAIFDATGARLFRLPMTPERVLEALRGVKAAG
jgi:aerobic-type carbon monoxide dehydrogenase small subunit (CoxS/CutS family)